MLRFKFQYHRTSYSGEDFDIFTKYGHGGHLDHVIWAIYTNVRSPFPRMALAKRFQRKRFFNIVNGRMDGRTSEHGYAIS